MVKATSKRSPWLAENPSKRWCELFFLCYSPVWIVCLLCVVVPFGWYRAWDEWGYLWCGLLTAAPLVVWPLLFPGAADRGKPLAERYWVKANLWQAIFGFIGNYFWTHYFFQLLGASYTMPSHRLNNIPVVMFLLTHAYFCLYHALSNMIIRRTLHACASLGPAGSWSCAGLVIFVLAYTTAFMETFTISHYPYYRFKDASIMYSVGSLFYAIYFWVSFPAFFMMDEHSRKGKSPLWRAAWDALASGMLVTILLDLWRVCIGPIYRSGAANPGMPFMNGLS